MSVLAATDVGFGRKTGGGIGAGLRTRFDKVIFLYILSALTILQGIYTLLEGMRAARYIRDYQTPEPPLGEPGLSTRTAVFCPCKGVDHEFEKNIRSILDQDFENFTVYFILESENDPARGVLKSIGVRNILIAGEAADCGQKVHNLQYAVRTVGSTADVYVFSDSDARYPRNWLAELTAPLGVKQDAITTGYRWYTVRRFHVPTLLRSAWNSTALGILGDHGRNFAWGGSTAMRRDTFERIGVLASWRGALSDDYAIRRAAEAAGLGIRFVPPCLIPSHGECSFAEMLEFTTRQITITRVYSPRLWTIGFIAQAVFNVTFWTLFAGALWMRSPGLGVCWAIIYALSAARSALRIFAVETRINDPSPSRFALFYVLASPLIALLYQYNMTSAAFTKDIEWRQIHYSLISPNETRVRRPPAGAK